MVSFSLFLSKVKFSLVLDSSLSLLVSYCVNCNFIKFQYLSYSISRSIIFGCPELHVLANSCWQAYCKESLLKFRVVPQE